MRKIYIVEECESIKIGWNTPDSEGMNLRFKQNVGNDERVMQYVNRNFTKDKNDMILFSMIDEAKKFYNEYI